ncbi:MAG: glycerate kinase [Muribaculaceae bacterium]|nr:glycerate kinase [Muribaculaceae bacterium]
MKIIVAADSFKGSLSSLEVGEAARKGILDAKPEAHVDVIGIADGGEGTVRAIVEARKGDYITLTVTGPLGTPVEAVYGRCGDMAVIEVAAACGLALVERDRQNPGITTTYGVGEMISDALRRGCRNFLIGLGGSATNDAGAGMLRALGYRFLDAAGSDTGDGGLETGRIVRIDDSDVIPQLKDARFTVACDVSNPLTGPWGASRIFAPQKGASREMVLDLDTALTSFAAVVARHFNADFSDTPGAGAAGGLGFAFISFLHGHPEPGIEMVLDAVGFNHRLKDASLVITGEGRLDKQTLMGKAPYGVLERAVQRGIPVIGIGGAVETAAVDELLSAGFSAIFPIVDGPCPLAEAMRPEKARENIRRSLRMIMRCRLDAGASSRCD